MPGSSSFARAPLLQHPEAARGRRVARPRRQGARHHEVAISLDKAEPELSHRGKLLSSYDGMIPQIGASLTFYGTAVVRQFEQMGVLLRQLRARDREFVVGEGSALDGTAIRDSGPRDRDIVVLSLPRGEKIQRRRRRKLAPRPPEPPAE